MSTKTIRFKEVSFGIFELKMSYSSTVLDAKKMIAEKYNINEKNISLIWDGEALKNEKRLYDLYIYQDKFIVCHVIYEKEPKQKSVPNSEHAGIKIKPEPKKEEKIPEGVKELIGMGFERSQCEKALKKVGNNVNLAIDLLLSTGSF